MKSTLDIIASYTGCKKKKKKALKFSAELDEAVDPEFLGRHERTRGAQRPLVAAEAGSREAHRATRADDDHLGDERQPGEDSESGGDGHT